MKRIIRNYSFVVIGLFAILLVTIFSMDGSYSATNSLINTRTELSTMVKNNEERIAELNSKVAFKVGVHNIYVGGTKVVSLDTSKSYTLTDQQCNAGEVVTWDDSTKNISISNLTSNTVCDLYFSIN